MSTPKPPGPPTQKYQKLGSPGPPGAHNLHAGGFRHGEKDFDGPGTQKATKKFKMSISKTIFSYFLRVGGGGWNNR